MHGELTPDQLLPIDPARDDTLLLVKLSLASAAPVDAAALARVLAPGTTSCMLPAAAYLDDAVLAWERTHLFARAWVCAGRADDLAAVGARRAVEVGDDAVLLVRGEDGVLRGFYNVCQHRAHELAPCGETGGHPSIHCPYHGVALRARRRAAVDAALRRASGLRPLPARARAGAHRRVARLGDGQRQWRRRAVRRVPRRRGDATSPTTSRSASSWAPRTPTSWPRTGSLSSRTTRSASTVRSSIPSCARSARRRAARTTSGTRASGSAGGRTSCRTPSRCRSRASHPRCHCAGCGASPRGASTTSVCCRTCSSACTRTT